MIWGINPSERKAVIAALVTMATIVSLILAGQMGFKPWWPLTLLAGTCGVVAMLLLGRSSKKD